MERPPGPLFYQVSNFLETNTWFMATALLPMLIFNFNSLLIPYFPGPGGLGPLVSDQDQLGRNNNSKEPYLELLTYLLNQTRDKLLRTLTVSYGEDE